MSTTKKRFKTIDEYIKTFPKDVQSILEKLRQTIRRAAPEAVEAIGYQMPTFKLNGRYLVYFAGWKNHIGFYPMPSGTEAFKKELLQYKGAKGSIQFPIDKPIPEIREFTRKAEIDSTFEAQSVEHPVYRA